jgi:hypothetical protein
MPGFFRTIVTVGTLALFVLGGTARAYDTCGELSSAKRENDGRKADLIAQYPGTMLTLLGCAGYAASQPEDQQVGAFLLACGGSCLLVGLDNCANLAGDVIAIATREEQLKRDANRNGCILPD